MQTPQAGMDSIAASYGLTLESVRLAGIFTLLREGSSLTRMRNLYIAHCEEEKETQLPDIIDEVRWLPVEDALSLLSFESIAVLIDQVCAERDNVWAGCIQSYKEDDRSKARIMEEFYSIYSSK